MAKPKAFECRGAWGVERDGAVIYEASFVEATARRIDRQLQKQGHAILRFTGSQITADPKACATEVRDFIENRKATT